MRAVPAARRRASCSRSAAAPAAAAARSRLRRLPARPLHDGVPRGDRCGSRRNTGDAAAMTLLGELYNQGLGVASRSRRRPPNGTASRRSAATPHALASLGLMALDGRGMAKNQAQGRAWLEEAAAKGEPVGLLQPRPAPAHQRQPTRICNGPSSCCGRPRRRRSPDAQHALGVLYLKGRGVARERAGGRPPVRARGRNGSSVGEVEYAILLFNGDGVPANEAQAARYFRRAAAKGNAIAQNRLARLSSPAAACRRTRSRPPPGTSSPPPRASPTPGSTMPSRT